VLLTLTLLLKSAMHVAVSCYITGLVEQHNSNWQSLTLHFFVVVAWLRFADQHRYVVRTTFRYS